MSLEDANYYGDRRVRAAEAQRVFRDLDERRMTAKMDLGDEEDVTVHVRYGVCPTCNGKGRHVNPSIDAGGISGETFREDPDFAAAYFAGDCDVDCYGCGGKRVVLELDRVHNSSKVTNAFDKDARERAEADAVERAERRMGA